MSTAALALPVPASVTLKTPDQFRLTGKVADRLDAPAESAGNVNAWKRTIVSPSILKGAAFEQFLEDGVDSTAVEGVADTACDLPVAATVHHPEVPVPVLWWRSVGHPHSAFVMETLIDRIARESDQDPVAPRRKLLAGHPRHLAGRPGLGGGEVRIRREAAAVGAGMGVAVHESFNSVVVAHVVELSLEGGRPKLHQATSAIHCNLAVNPRSVEAQVQGAALMAIGMTLDGAETTLRDGQVRQSSFHGYIVPRMPDVPPIDVHIVPSGDPPAGVGEPGLPPMAPAIANAIHALTGRNMQTSFSASRVRNRALVGCRPFDLLPSSALTAMTA